MPQSETGNSPRALIIAGPNGAGKTTFAREFLPMEAHCPAFINADLIATGLSPFRPDAAAIEASRLMLEHVRRRAAALEDFAIETTLAGRTYRRFITEWKQAGYQVDLMFLQLPSAELAWNVSAGERNKADTASRKMIFAVDSIAVSKTSRKSIAESSTNGGYMTPASGRRFFWTKGSIHDPERCNT